MWYVNCSHYAYKVSKVDGVFFVFLSGANLTSKSQWDLSTYSNSFFDLLRLIKKENTSKSHQKSPNRKRGRSKSTPDSGKKKTKNVDEVIAQRKAERKAKEDKEKQEEPAREDKYKAYGQCLNRSLDEAKPQSGKSHGPALDRAIVRNISQWILEKLKESKSEEFGKISLMVKFLRVKFRWCHSKTSKNSIDFGSSMCLMRLSKVPTYDISL